MKNKKITLAYLSALIPLASAALYVLLLAITSGIGYEPGKFHFITPLGQQNVSELSLVWFIVAAATVFLWGFCGKKTAKSGVGMIKMTLVANALPILSVILYIVLFIVGGEDTAAICTLGFGMFLIPGNFIYGLVPLNYVEIIVDTVLMLGTFAIGYAIGVGEKEKK